MPTSCGLPQAAGRPKPTWALISMQTALLPHDGAGVWSQRLDVFSPEDALRTAVPAVIVRARAVKHHPAEGRSGRFPFHRRLLHREGTPNRISSTYGEDRYRSFLPQLSERTLQGYQFISDCPYCGTRASSALPATIRKRG